MRIAVVTPFLDKRHGTERALAEQLERLASRYACEVHLFSQRVIDISFQASATPPAQARGAIFWHKVPSFPGPHLFQYLAWVLGNTFLRWSSQAFGKLRFDLTFSAGINCLDADAVFIQVIFTRLRYLSRGDPEDRLLMGGFFRSLHRRAYYALLSALESRVYANPRVTLAAVSLRTAGFLAEYFRRSDARIIPNSVDSTQFSIAARAARRNHARTRRNFRDTDFVLLLIGNDWRMKGVPTVLAAMAVLGDLPLRFLIVGDDVQAPFQQLADSLHISSACRWERTSPDVLEMYSAADLYVSPSHEDAFAFPPLEAMACGLPVITSIHNGGAQIITPGEDGFVLSDSNDSSALAELLRLLYSDPELRRKIGEKASQTAQIYNWHANAEATWQFLKDALEHKAAFAKDRDRKPISSPPAPPSASPPK